MESRTNDNSGFAGINIRRKRGDKDVIDRFFVEHQEIKRGDFFRDAIIEKIERENEIERERQRIREGRTQVDWESLSPEEREELVEDER